MNRTSVLHTKSCILHIICKILYVTSYYMTQRWLWYKFLKHKTLHIVKTYCSLDKIKNHKSSHFSCFKRSIFSFLIIIISSASIEIINGQNSTGQWIPGLTVRRPFWASHDTLFRKFPDWSSEFHLPMNEILSQTDKILLVKTHYGSRGLLEVNFKGLVKTSSRRNNRISNISLEQGV